MKMDAKQALKTISGNSQLVIKIFSSPTNSLSLKMTFVIRDVSKLLVLDQMISNLHLRSTSESRLLDTQVPVGYANLPPVKENREWLP